MIKELNLVETGFLSLQKDRICSLTILHVLQNNFDNIAKIKARIYKGNTINSII